MDDKTLQASSELKLFTVIYIWIIQHLTDRWRYVTFIISKWCFTFNFHLSKSLKAPILISLNCHLYPLICFLVSGCPKAKPLLNPWSFICFVNQTKCSCSRLSFHPIFYLWRSLNFRHPPRSQCTYVPFRAGRKCNHVRLSVCSPNKSRKCIGNTSQTWTAKQICRGTYCCTSFRLGCPFGWLEFLWVQDCKLVGRFSG